MQYFSILFFIMMVVLAFGNNVDLFSKYIGFIFILVLIHNGLALSTGFGMATIFKLPFADRRTVIEKAHAVFLHPFPAKSLQTERI